MDTVLHRLKIITAICGILLIGCSDTGDSDEDSDIGRGNCTIGSESCPCTLGGGCDQGLQCVGTTCEPLTTDTCQIGGERCPCTAGGACDPGLTCLSNICVNANGGNTDTSTGEDNGDNVNLPSSNPDCQYPIDCFGAICDGATPCCSGASCADEWYSEESFIENYCYPSCSGQGEEAECLCDDICVSLDGGTAWCLTPGTVKIDDLSVKIMALDAEASEFEITDILPAEIEASISGQVLPLNLAHAYITEDNEAVIQMEGMGSLTGIWMAIVAIPLDNLKVGGPITASVDPAAETYDFWAWIYSGTIPADTVTGEIERFWAESIFDYEESTLTIDAVGAPCAVPGSQECTFYQFDLNLSFFSLKSEME